MNFRRLIVSLLAHTFPPSVESAAPRTRRPRFLGFWLMACSSSTRSSRPDQFQTRGGRFLQGRSVRTRGAAVGRFGLVLSSEIRLLEAALLAWFRTFGRDLPWRKTSDPYSILVSEVMLQQTQVERVIPRYRRWLERWPTAEALARRLAGGRDPRVAGARLQPASGQPPPRGAADRRAGLARRPDRTARRGRLHRGGDPQLRLRRAGASGRHERAPRAGAHRSTFGPECAQALFDLGATVCLARVPRCGICPSQQTAPRAERATSRCASSRASRARSGSAVPRHSVQSRTARAPRRARRRGRRRARARRPRSSRSRSRRAP